MKRWLSVCFAAGLINAQDVPQSPSTTPDSLPASAAEPSPDLTPEAAPDSATEPPPETTPETAPEPAPAPLPDHPESGGLLDILPGRIDPMALPVDGPRSGASLFPPDLWPPGPPPSRESFPDPPAPLTADELDACISSGDSFSDPRNAVSAITAARLVSALRPTSDAPLTLLWLTVPALPNLPAAWNPEAALDRHFGPQPAALILSPLDSPDRSLVFLSPAAANRPHPIPLADLVAHAAHRAVQLDSPDARAILMAMDVQHALATLPPPAPPAPIRITAAPPRPRDLRLPTAAAVFLTIASTIWWLRRRLTLSPRPILLPDSPAAPRLSAPYSGGHGASVRFHLRRP